MQVVNHAYHFTMVSPKCEEYLIHEICSDEGIQRTDKYAYSAIYKFEDEAITFNSIDKREYNCYSVEQVVHKLFECNFTNGYAYVNPPLSFFYENFKPMLDHIRDDLWHKYGYNFQSKDEVTSYVDQAVCELYQKGMYLWKGIIEKTAGNLVKKEIKAICARRELGRNLESDYNENDYDDGKTDEELLAEVFEVFEQRGYDVNVIMDKIVDKKIDCGTSRRIRKVREDLCSDYVPKSRGVKRGSHK